MYLGHERSTCQEIPQWQNARVQKNFFDNGYIEVISKCL